MRKFSLALLCILALSVPAQAAFDFEWEIEEQVLIGGDWDYLEFRTVVTNTGDEIDSFHINKSEMLPGLTWQAAICVGEHCHAPFINDVDTDPVPPGGTVEIRIDISVGTDLGTAFTTLTVSSNGDPGLSESADFTAIHQACDVLLVDGADKSENLWQDIPAAMPGDKSMGVWPRRDAQPTLTEMQQFPAAMWLDGSSGPGLGYEDRVLIYNYLYGGFPMLLSGQDLAQDVYGDGEGDWFEDTLGLEYTGNGTSLDIAGEGGDDLGDGLAFTLGGAQSDPDLIGVVTADPVSVSFRYDSNPNMGEIAGVTRGGDIDLIYLAFGLEGVGGDLGTILERACEVLVPTSGYAFHWEIDKQVGMGPDWEYIEFHAVLTNTGDQTDIYDLHKDDFLPEGYMASICVGETCHAPFVNDVVTDPVFPGGELEIRIDMTIGDEPATGFSTLTITSQGDGSQSTSGDFTSIHQDCDMLLVDDAAKDENLWQNIPAAMPAGKSLGVWPRRDQTPTLDELKIWPGALWLTGNTQPTLDTDDRDLVEHYLDDGYTMILSGQDIAEDVTASGHALWLQHVLGVSYLGNSSSLDLAGEAGDHMGDGLAFTLDASQTDPDLIETDVLEPVYSLSFRYASGPETGEEAGVTFGSESRHAFLGFGLEGTGDDLTTLLERSCEFLGAQVSVDPDQAPAQLALRGNYPNPFNPLTTFSFSAPEAGDAKIEILDIRGRRINTLAVKVQAGSNEVPFLAKDARGHDLPSGVYLYRVSLGEEKVDGKMILLK